MELTKNYALNSGTYNISSQFLTIVNMKNGINRFLKNVS